MRLLAFMAFMALQLSVFTCGFDIHVHAAGIDNGHIAEHLHDNGADHKQDDSHDHGCHVHASHAFTMLEMEHLDAPPIASTVQSFVSPGFDLKSLPFLIEHPPKLLHS